MLKYELGSLSGSLGCFGLKSCLGVLISLVVLICSPIGTITRREARGPWIRWGVYCEILVVAIARVTI